MRYPDAMMVRVAIVLLPLALLSCTAPCSSPAARELAKVEDLIAQTRQNLARGYTYAPSGGAGLDLCLGGITDNVGLSLCTDAQSRGRAVPVDPAAEKRRLALLESRAEALRAQAARERAACGG